MAWTSPRTWLSGETLTAALLNTHLRDNLKALGDAWTAYTPSWTAATTNPTLGNGTLTGAYRRVGKTVDYRVTLTIGSTTTLGSGVYSFSIPVAAVDQQAAGTTVVTGGGSRNSGGAEVVTGALSAVRALHGSGSVTGSSPFALTTGDVINVAGCYETA